MAFDDTKNDSAVLLLISFIVIGVSLGLHRHGLVVVSWIGIALGVGLIGYGWWLGRPWIRRD